MQVTEKNKDLADEPISRILCGAPLCSGAPRRSFL